jgi:membrane protease YdiL (CAAX protease family)
MSTFSYTTPGSRRIAAILEVVGVYMTGLLLGFILMKFLGVNNPLEMLRTNRDVDLLVASRDLALLLLCQYIGIMLPAFLIGWWHRKRPFRKYGMSLAERPLSHHILTGVVVFAVAELPYKIMVLIDHLIPLGEKAFTQEIAFSLNWGDFKSWIFMAVGSFLLVPILEEIFHRGYVQTRLAEDFDAPSAILMAAFLFAFSHRQYFDPSIWNIGVLITSLFEAIAWGYIFYRTKSLVAVMVAHALVNFPVRGVVDFVLPALMLVIIIVCRNPILEEIRRFWVMLKSDVASWLITAIGMTGMLVFMAVYAVAEDVVVLLGLPLLVAALVMEFIEKRNLHRVGPMQEGQAKAA